MDSDSPKAGNVVLDITAQLEKKRKRDREKDPYSGFPEHLHTQLVQSEKDMVPVTAVYDWFAVAADRFKPYEPRFRTRHPFLDVPEFAPLRSMRWFGSETLGDFLGTMSIASGERADKRLLALGFHVQHDGSRQNEALLFMNFCHREIAKAFKKANVPDWPAKVIRYAESLHVHPQPPLAHDAPDNYLCFLVPLQPKPERRMPRSDEQ